MHAPRIDRTARGWATAADRRRVLAGLLAAGLGVPAAASGAAAHVATPTAEEGPAWLFVQRFATAMLAPDPATPEEYLLTLSGLDPAVLAFTDHPDRLVATVPTAAFAETVSAAAVDPLNATLVAAPAAGGGEVAAVVVLGEATHDAAAGSITYRVVVLAEAEGPLPPEPLAGSPRTQELGVGHLFVDADTSGETAGAISGEMPGAKDAVVAPSYAAGAIFAAHSIHKTKRQHD